MFEYGDKDVPASACVFQIGELEISQANGEGSKTAPFKLVARSGRAINHPYWGVVAHDLSGMKLPHRGRVAVDYAHSQEVVGYANRFNIGSGDLEASGALVPFKDSDRATEIIFKSHEGVPYEASISFAGEPLKLEKVPAGKTAHVNGFELEGPATIVREWPLRSIAICKEGADQWTHAEFSAGDRVAVEFIPQEEPAMATETATPVDETTQSVEAEATQVAVDAEAAPNTAEGNEDQPQTAASATVDAALSSRATEGSRFMARFGESQGAIYFARGLTFEAALEQHLAFQAGEIERLKQATSFSSQSMGEDQPLQFSERVAPKEKKPMLTLP